MTDLAERRRSLERTAVVLLVGYALVFAVVCSGIIVAGWFAGVLEDHAERFFWAGAVLAFLDVAVLAAAVVPGGGNDGRAVARMRVLITIGLVLFVAAPAIVIGSLVADFYG